MANLLPRHALRFAANRPAARSGTRVSARWSLCTRSGRCSRPLSFECPRTGCDLNGWLFLKKTRTVIEVGKNPVVIELVRRAQDPQVFLRMAAIELRRLAEKDPDTAAELRRVAQELEVEAEDLTPRDPE
jgi:hypothetical protein